MQATAVYVRNPFQPARDREIKPVRRRLRIQTLAPKTNLPFICLYNGAPLLRADWRRCVQDGDIVAFVTLPQNGGGGRGGSNPLSIVLAIAVMAVAPYAGAALAGATGIGTAAAWGTAVSFVGMALVQALVPPPRPPSAQIAASYSAPSPTYSLQAQGNQARLESPIPVIYGRHQVWPDFAAEPYGEYVGNEQYLYQLLCIGQGYYDIEQIRIEDTDIASFTEITYEVVQPGGDVTLFPTNVVTSPEVSGQEMLTGTALGPFVANAAVTLANAIAIDVVCPKGLYYANDAGGLDAKSVTFTVEARLIDNYGLPVTGAVWTLLGTQTITAATNTPQRASYRYDVADGRYEVRATRTDTKDTNSRAGHDLNWAGLRAYLPGVQQYGDVTMIAMRMLATNNLSAQSSRRVNLIVQRKLLMWNPTTGWSQPTATRSIAWAFADACRAAYGGDYSDARIDLNQLYTLDATWAARGDYFDGVFDSRMVLWEGLTQIARVGRAIPYRQGGIVHIVRDQAQTIPVAMFTMRNIVRGSLSIEYVMPTDETADSVTLDYFDSIAWTWMQVQAVLPGSTAVKPAKAKLFGATGHDHVWREGMFMAATNRYRRKLITFQTEMEGFIPTVGDLIVVTHDIPGWGQSGDITAVNGLILTTSEPLIWSAGVTHYIGLRKRDGTMSGPWAVTQGATEYEAVLGAALDFTPYTGGNEERTHFAFGPGTAKMYQRARVIPPLKPRGNRVEINCVNEDEAVHTADQGTVPAQITPWNLPGSITSPVIADLTATVGGTPDSMTLNLSWLPAAGADHYLIESSKDGVAYTRVADTTSSSYALPVGAGLIYLRVAGVGLIRGDWVYWNGDPATMISIPADVTGLALSEPFIGTQCTIKWNAAARADYYTVAIWGGSPSVLRRTINTYDISYAYTLETAQLDGGPWRDLTFKVTAVNGAGISAIVATVSANNPAPAMLTGVQVFAGYLSAYVLYNLPADIDFAGIRVCMSTVSGFTPDATNVVYQGGDRVASITGLVGGTTYYFRMAAYDTFGTDGMTFTTAQYNITATAAGNKTGAEILNDINAILADPATPNKLILTAEHFAIQSPTTQKYPFAISNIGGVDYVALNADVIINGNLNVSNLETGALPTDVQMLLGGGTIVLDGAGAISIYKALGENQDYLLLTAARLSFQKYVTGLGYVEYNTLRRRESGVANSNVVTNIPGYWNAMPDVQVSINSVRAFDVAYASQSQDWQCEYQTLEEYSPGQWRFTPIARLIVAATSGSTGVNISSGVIATDAWSSGTFTTPGNASSATFNVSFSSSHGAGTSGTYYYRSVRWRVHYGANVTGWQTKLIGATLSSVSDSMAVTFGSSAAWLCYIEFEAFDTDATTFSSGGVVYDYATDTVATITTQYVKGCNLGGVVPLNSYTTPATWEIYQVSYFIDISVKNGNNDGSYTYVGCWRRDGDYTTPGYAVSFETLTCTVQTSSYNSSYWDTFRECGVSGTGNNGPGSLYAKNTRATVYRRKAQANTAIANQSTVSDYSWNLSAANIIASGALNWMAIGE